MGANGEGGPASLLKRVANRSVGTCAPQRVIGWYGRGNGAPLALYATHTTALLEEWKADGRHTSRFNKGVCSGALAVAVVGVGVWWYGKEGGKGTWVQTWGKGHAGRRERLKCGEINCPPFHLIRQTSRRTYPRDAAQKVPSLMYLDGDAETVAPSVLTYTALWESTTASFAILSGTDCQQMRVPGIFSLCSPSSKTA